MSESPSELGGYKEVIVRIAGLGAYSKLNSNPAATACKGCRPPRPRAHPYLGLYRGGNAGSRELADVVINNSDLRI